MQEDNLLNWMKGRQENNNKLAPIEIKNKEFSKKLKGYAIHEVNDYLLEVYESYRQLFEENTLLKERLNFYAEELKKFKDKETQMNAAILNAQEMADKLKSKATKEGTEFVKNAKDEADATIVKAKTEADNLLKEAKDKKQKTLAELEELKQRYLNDIKTLKSYREELFGELKTYFQKKALELQKIAESIKNENKSQSNPPREIK